MTMDISRPDLKAKKRKRQALTIAVGVVVLAVVTFLVMRFEAGRAYCGPLCRMD
jgi:F0F1-type ATP synthase assembly protein I